MNFEPLEKIANAVLYEGFLLYPYRKSSVKNRQRWHFGTLGPAGGSDTSSMQTECLVEVDPGLINPTDRSLTVTALKEASMGEGDCICGPGVDIRIRFLQDEIEREIELAAGVHVSSARSEFSFPPVALAVEVECARLSGALFRLTVRIVNTGSVGSMLSTHTMLGVRGGAFISLLDPPEEYRAAALGCRNTGTWPVLAGREGERHLMLSSPIILYDYPQIAPESAGNFFDGTEIDEMLTLRVLTLSDDEKRELRNGGDKGREILERTEMLPREQFGRMHGAIRSLRKTAKLEFREGDRVRLHPRKKADIFDIALNGKVAVVESVERDFEDRVHLAVTVEDDPGRDFGIARQIAHRFFFSPEEVELL
jgi:hypothetical protein